MTKVVILGAGFTGLSTAYHLEQNNFYDFKIFDKENKAGGLLRSFKQDGFTFDFTGHLLHIKNPEFYNFLNSIAGIKNFIKKERNSFIYTNQKFIPYPFQSNLYNLPKEIKIECIKGYINRKKNIQNVSNFYQWVLKYFGKGIGKHFFFPYNKKLLSYNLKKITPSWTGRFVPQVNLDLILNSAFKNKKQNIGYNSSFYYPIKDGIEFLINKLEKKIKTKIQQNHKAINIDPKNKIILFENGHTEKYEKLITTIPLNILLSNLKEKSNTNLKNISNKLICNSVININLGFHRDIDNEKHWIYFPEKNYPFYRIGFWHNINKNSAPKNHSSIYTEISYIQNKVTKKQINKLLNIKIENHLKLLSIDEKKIITKKTLHIDNAYVIYDLWREKNIKKIHKLLNNLNIFSVGRYGEWKYSSMEEAFFDGKNTADKILKTYLFKNNVYISQKYKGLGI